MVTSLRENPGTAWLQMLTACLAILVAVVLFLFLAPPNVQAQTFTVLHTFEDGQDGTKPFTGVAIDRAGNLYGVAYGGGGTGGTCYLGCGTAFKLTKHGGSWIYSTIYRYQGPPDGAYPAGIMIGPDGSLYGATYGGGIVNQGSCVLDVYGCGTVFKIQPPASFCKTADCPWNESVLYRFTGENGDAGGPYNGDVIFDGGGNLYGTTEEGGAHQAGAAYKLTPSCGGWSESVIYSFDPSGFSIPQTGLILDHSGNLYGTTIAGSNYDGATYQLSPSQSGYIATVLFASQCSAPAGCFPGSLTFDPSGNIVGATQLGNGYYNGSVYELVASSGWSLNTIFNFTGRQGANAGRLAMDAAGNLYGAAASGGAHGYGNVFKLTKYGSSYVYSDLYDFTAGTDGANPYGAVTLDADGNIYGTTEDAGDNHKCLGVGGSGCGTVWELTQQ